MRNVFFGVILLLALTVPMAALACSGAGENKHIGTLTKVDTQSKTFTIKDAETSNKITFTANDDILKGLKGFKGRVMVSYEEAAGGDLEATGVTF